MSRRGAPPRSTHERAALGVAGATPRRPAGHPQRKPGWRRSLDRGATTSRRCGGPRPGCAKYWRRSSSGTGGCGISRIQYPEIPHEYPFELHAIRAAPGLAGIMQDAVLIRQFRDCRGRNHLRARRQFRLAGFLAQYALKPPRTTPWLSLRSRDCCGGRNPAHRLPGCPRCFRAGLCPRSASASTLPSPT